MFSSMECFKTMRDDTSIYAVEMDRLQPQTRQNISPLPRCHFLSPVSYQVSCQGSAVIMGQIRDNLTLPPVGKLWNLLTHIFAIAKALKKIIINRSKTKEISLDSWHYRQLLLISETAIFPIESHLKSHKKQT